MKSSSSSGKTTSGSSKNKKSSREREKRKSQSTTETNTQQNSEKSSPSKDSNTRKYVGYGPDQLTIIAEQSISEHLTEDVCGAFVEDINYKIRYIIYDALIKARLCGRNFITAIDVDDTFENLQLDKVYGASSSPKWILFGDQNLQYLDDTKINLIDLAEEPNVFIQPDESVLSRKWLPETKEVSNNLRLYFVLMCQAVVEKDLEVRLTALGDISRNNLIGPVIEWFYHFGYFLLSKDITYDSLTLRAFDLIEALESNPISSLIVSDKQIMLLTRLLLQRLLRSISTSEVLKPMCRVLSILCMRVVPRKIILKKMISKFLEVKDDFAVPVICAVNELGLDAILAIVFPHLSNLLQIAKEQREPELIHELLRSYYFLGVQNIHLPVLRSIFYDAFYNIFDDGILPFWKHQRHSTTDNPKVDYNWVNVRKQLLKSRHKITPCRSGKQKSISIEEVFLKENYACRKTKMEVFDYAEEKPQSLKPRVSFKFHNIRHTVNQRLQLMNSNYNVNLIPETSVIIGKRTLLIPILSSFINNTAKSTKCTDHTLLYHNL